jgi:hypothetical protein
MNAENTPLVALPTHYDSTAHSEPFAVLKQKILAA